MLALPLFWAWALYAARPLTLWRQQRRAVWAAVAAGLAGYYLGALINFYALTLISASLERVLLFSYPALVLLALCLAVLTVQRNAAPPGPVAGTELPALSYDIPTLPVDAHETSVLTALVVGGDVPE